MTTRSDMVELARSRTTINNNVAKRKAARAQIIKNKDTYITIKEIAAERGLKPDTIRYVLRNETPTKVPAFNDSGRKSYAFGYTQSQISKAFSISPRNNQ